MASTQNSAPSRRGNSRGPAYGYPIAPGEKIYSGSLVCVNALGQSVRPQTAGALNFVGIAQNSIDNSASATAGGNIVAAMDDFAYPVPTATASNITAPVYCTDDNTLTLSVPGTGFAKVVGHISGIDNGKTFVEFKGY
ncbi:MAG: hypothetical protein B7Z80_04595 [Rhodospirillales bacterium 20-64-7]|nr:MAG: hypothetical protein B7Z80_04595 [Rhodospirillales bacterium 20-64-7]